MAQFTKLQLIKNIEGLNLDLALKKELIDYINNQPQVTPELITWLREKIQVQINKNFEELGVGIDEKDPAYIAAYNAMVEEINAAEEELKEEIECIDEASKEEVVSTLHAIDDIDISTVEQKIAEA